MRGAVDNVLAWRHGASDDDVAAGRDWYPHARKVTAAMATAHGVPLDVAAGVVAVLSPRCDWSANLTAADTVLRAHARGEPMPTGLPGAYSGNVVKAWRIARHGSSYPQCDGTRDGARGARIQCAPKRHRCAAAGYLHGPKVCEFAATILGDRDGRVMDVWATRAADTHPRDALTLGPDDSRRVGDPTGRVATLQRAYAEAAAAIGEDARVTQAIVWTRIRRVWLRSDGRRSGIRSAPIPF